jgi:hypothetical protein
MALIWWVYKVIILIFDNSNWMLANCCCYFFNRSCLDENKAFLTTADSAVKLLPDATKSVSGWKGLEYRTAFPVIKPPGANFYPADMDKKVCLIQL